MITTIVHSQKGFQGVEGPSAKPGGSFSFLFFSFPEVKNKDSIKVEMYSKLRQKQFKGLVQVFKIGFAQLLLEKMLKCQILFGSLRTNKLTTKGT